MKMKYLSLALAAALATTLTACGKSDDKSFVKPIPSTPSTPGTTPSTPGTTPSTPGTTPSTPGTTPSTPGTTPSTPGTTPSTPGTTPSTPGTTPSTPGTTPSTPGTVEDNNNVDGISKGGKLSEKLGTGAQHHVRETKSEFNLKNDPQTGKVRGVGMVTNFDELANKEMANIVVARNKAAREDDRVTFYIGTPVSDRSRQDALQRYNEVYVDPTLDTVSNTAKNNGLVYHKGLLGTATGAVTADTYKDIAANVEGSERFQSDVRSRFFGANWLANADDSVVNSKNSRMFKRYNESTNKTWNATNNGNMLQSDLLAKTDKIDLKKVQYGRVTAQLEDLDDYNKSSAGVEQINGRYYYQIAPNKTDHKTKYLNIGNNDASKKDVNFYFFRGNDRTTDMPTSGTAYYYGQALMYGLDNSFHGTGKKGGNSNSVVVADPTYVDALGNFVKATVNFGNSAVEGSVYNVWRKVDGKLKKDDLVTFKGKIVGKNNVWGSAGRTYVNDGAHDADFQAGFFGSKAAEMGGSFSSIRHKDGKATYGDVKWGGVFGAKKDVAAPVDDNDSGPEGE